MSSYVLTSVNGSLTFDLGATPNDRRAFAYSLTSAQGDARAVDADPSSDTYFSTMLQSLEALGWTALWRGTCESASPTPTAASLSIAQGMAASAQVQLGAAPAIPGIDPASFAQFDVSRLYTYLATAEDIAADVLTLLDAWWERTIASSTARRMQFGPLVRVGPLPMVLVSFARVDGLAASWKSLFTAKPVEPLDYDARAVLLSLSVPTYEQQHEALERRLADEVGAHIAEATLEI